MNDDAIVLDFDASVGPLAGEQRIDFGNWQEAIRFGCGLAQMAALQREFAARMPSPRAHGTVFTGSGDFHHVSWPLIERQIHALAGTALRVVVLDNHPDNMRFPWGVHCGSWVRRVAMMPQVTHVHVVGITSGDIGWRHAWENYLRPLRAGKLSYWSAGVPTGWARWCGVQHAFRTFADVRTLAGELAAMLARERMPTYLSIDKDVFAPDVVRTNWDQGKLQEPHLTAVIEALQGQIVASDVTGDVSSYRYRTAWKRWLSAGDGQETTISPSQLLQWQAAQGALNQRLLLRLQAAQCD